MHCSLLSRALCRALSGARPLSFVSLCLTHLQLEGVRPRKSSPGNVHTSNVEGNYKELGDRDNSLS